MPPLNKPYRKFHHLQLQPPVDVRVEPEDGEPLVFDEETNKFEPSVNMVLQELDVDYIDFDTTYADGITEGRLQWNPEDGTLEIGMPGGAVVLQIGQEMTQLVFNDEGGPIADGTPVYISGGSIDRPEVKIADRGTFAEAAVFGLTTEAIDTGATGYTTSFGLVRGINTAGFVAGETLWLDTAGALTNVRPTPGTATALMVGVGVCLYSDASDGVIFVNTYIVPRLLGLSDVLSIPLNDGDVPIWVAANARFEFFNPSVTAEKEVPWTFQSPGGSTGVDYYGGFYQFFSGNNNFGGVVTFGSVNAAKAAHFFVVLGELAVDEITITVTGTSITDAGVRTPADTDTIVIPNATPVDTYFETPKKWLGQVSVTVTSGTPKQCNYGYSKYWDNGNRDYTVTGFEVTWLGGANDANPNIQLIHHSPIGWTYNAGSTPSHPTPIADMAAIYGAEKQVVNGEHGAFKVTGVTVDIDGSVDEGTIWAITNSSNNAFELGNILMSVTPRI
jgi:hypothetical protein